MVNGNTKYKKINEDGTATVTIRFTATNSDKVYMFIPATTKNECKLYVNESSSGTYFGNESCCIVELGSFSAGETVSVKLELQKESVYLGSGCDYFATLDLDAFREIMPRLQTSSFDINTHSEDTLIGTIHILPGQELVYTSIPYDKGWVVTANGQEIETFEILGGLTAFRLDAGSYNLEMKYRPACALYGSILSVAGIVLFAAVWVGEYTVKKRRTKKAAILPEAVELSEADGAELDIAELDLGLAGRRSARLAGRRSGG